jgi:hypothetical protein
MNHEPKAVDDPRALALLNAGRRTAGVRYDVEAGLARHRSLVAVGALPGLSAHKFGKSLFGWSLPKIGVASLCLVASLGAYAVYGGASRSVRSAQVRLNPVTSVQSSTPALPSAQSPWTDEAQRALESHVRALPVDLPDTPVTTPGLRESARTVRTRTRVGEARTELRSSSLARPSARFDSSLARPGDARVASTPTSPSEPLARSLEHERVEATAAPEPTSSLQAPAASSVAAPASDSEDPTEREMNELALAERWLGSFPSRALSLARASDAQFRPGYLRQERRYVIIRALLALQRRDDAEREAARFTREDGDAGFAQRLRRALGE